MVNIIAALAVLALGVQAGDINAGISLPKSAPVPMESNVFGDQMMSKLNPRINFFNGCAPLVRYGIDGAIGYPTDVPFDTLKTCKSLSMAQIYGRYDAVSGWYVYAWFGVVDHPIARKFAYQWQFMAVLPEPGQAPSSINLVTTKAIWTPVDGYRKIFRSDQGSHPWVDQYRPNGYTAAGIQTAIADKSSQGRILPLIKVEGTENPWAGKPSVQLRADPFCPLSDVLWAHTLEIIKEHPLGIGHPEF